MVRTNKRLLIPFYLTNLFSGLLVMLPLYFALDDFIWKSTMRQQIGAAMDYNFLFEFLHYGSSGIAATQTMVTFVPLVYWIVALFLSGGALIVFARGDKYSPIVFWGGSAAIFGRFIRLFLMALPVLAVLFCLRYLESLAEYIIYGSDPYEYIMYWGAWVKLGLGFIGLILYGLIFDYARIHLAITDNRKVRKSLLAGIKFAARNPAKTLLLAFILFAAGGLMVLIYYLMSGLFTAGNWFGLALLILWQQLYIICRMALRLTLYSSEMEMYRNCSLPSVMA